MEARKIKRQAKVVVLEQPTLTFNDIINRMNDELRDPYAVAFVAHIYANLDAAGLFVCSNAEFAEKTGMSLSTMKKRKAALSEAGFIGYRTSKISSTYQAVTVYFLPMLGRSSENLVGSSDDQRSVAKQPKVGRETTKGRSSDDQYIYDDSYDDGDVDDSIIDAFSEIVGMVIRAGYNNLGDASKFDGVPRVLLDSWLEQAGSAENGGALLQHLFCQWEKSGRKELPPPPKKEKRQSLTDEYLQALADESPPVDGVNAFTETSPPAPLSKGEGEQVPADGLTLNWGSGLSNIPQNIPDAHADTWRLAYDQLSLQMGSEFSTWLRLAEYRGFADGTYRVQVHNGYAQDMCQHRYYRNIRRVLSDIHGAPVEIEFTAPPKKEQKLFKFAEVQS